MFDSLFKYLSSSVELVSVFSALLSMLGTLFSFYFTRLQKSKILRSVKKEKLEAALATDNILILGDYLTDTLETITIAQYSSNKDVAKDVNLFLNKIQSYLLPKDDIEKIELPKETEEQTIEYQQAPKEFESIIEELNTGEPWNALAKLRRFLEIYFRNYAMKRNIDVSNIKSVSQLFHRLYRGELINSPEFDKLKHAINISNRAIHGVDITREDAVKAINLVIDAFNQINK